MNEDTKITIIMTMVIIGLIVLAGLAGGITGA